MLTELVVHACDRQMNALPHPGPPPPDIEHLAESARLDDNMKMKFLMAILAALAVIQAGAGACSSAAHAAPAGGDMAGHAEAPHHHMMHAGMSQDSSPHAAMGQATMGHAAMMADHSAAGETLPECCISGGCAECALATGLPGLFGEARDAQLSPVHAIPAPHAHRVRALTSDPPPPRA